jgi:hypothetical protein
VTEQPRESIVDRLLPGRIRLDPRGPWAAVVSRRESWAYWSAPPGYGAPGVCWEIKFAQGGRQVRQHGIARTVPAARREIRRRLRRARKGKA